MDSLKKTIVLVAFCLIVSPAGGTWQAVRAASSDADSAFFEIKIRPVLADNCFTCHSDKAQMGGLRLDSAEAIRKGGQHGDVLGAGDPQKSRLIQAINYHGAIKMPPPGPLKPAEIADLTTWVKSGSPWPAAMNSLSPAASGEYVITGAQRRFWSFQPVREPMLPRVKNEPWIRSPIDRFVLSALESKGLRPAPEADRRTLIRRATFDLTGLPPTPAEVDGFLKDRSPNAFAHVVDRLLASPQYGERWGRHWLDLVRYCDSLDSRGLGSEGDISEAWRYRDWVVDAFNRDMPYDQFVINQIAGDLLPLPSGALRQSLPTAPIYLKGAGKVNAEGIIATGMLAIGNWGNGDADKEKILTDIADDQVDVISRTFMGLTVGCARCHDHKFDPIPTKDYYGLAGIFFSTHILPKLTPKGAGETPLRIPLLSAAEMDQRKTDAAHLDDLQKQLKTVSDSVHSEWARSLLPETARYVTAAWEYSHRPPGQGKLSLADYAAQNGLLEYALGQWLDYLTTGDYRLMTTPVKDLAGNTGIFAWKGDSDTPSATINTTSAAKSILTFTLPPKSVCVHPGPSNGVVVSWRSPITGTVHINGSVSDADPGGGNGIAWIIDHREVEGAQELASGEFPNGGSQIFSAGKGAEHLASIKVRAGDRLQLLVLPNGEYSFDTTVVDFTIEDGQHTWNVAKDVVPDPLMDGKGNPHPDSYGNAGVWEFLDMAASPRIKQGPLSPALDHWAHAVSNALPGDAGEVVVQAAAKEFASGFSTVDAQSPFWIRRAEDEKQIPAEKREPLLRLAAEIDRLKQNTPPPVIFANGAQDGGVPESSQAGFHDVRVHHRGSYENLGDMVPRHFPLILGGAKEPPITQGSGRLELARWLVNPNHPLTARVMVNRIWQHHFGEGIVRTPSNYGILGEQPSNPALLDYLASSFMKNGWSIKKMHREIMLSSTYRQSSEAPVLTAKLDPDNRLFGRMNRRRLESESLRDSLLAMSGKLDLTVGGPATRDFASPRRTLYVMTIRSDRSGYGPLFDAADSTAIVDRRTVSTVAPQALFMLNNPFVMDVARSLAQRVSTDPNAGDADRIANVYLLLYGRPASGEEIKIGQRFLALARARYVHPAVPQTAQPNLKVTSSTGPEARSMVASASPPVTAKGADEAAWKEYCQLLLCANEFLYVD